MEISPVVCDSHKWDSSTCTMVFCIVDNLANLKRKKSKDSFIFSCTLISFILLLMSLTSCKMLSMLSSVGKFNTDAG